MKSERAVAAFLGVCFVVTVLARSVDPNAFNYDVAFILYVAEQILGGEVLYREIIDENPPMVFWLSSIPVAVARIAGTTPILAFNMMVLLLAGVAGAFIQRILRQGWPNSTPSYRLALIFSFATVAIVYPGFDYGQRGNLFFILVTAYVFAAASAARDEPLSGWAGYGVGVMAGIGLAIKPYYVLLWLVVEVWVQLRNPGARAWLRRENRAIVAVQVLYASVALLFASDYLAVVKMAMAAYPAYGSFGSPMLLFHRATGVVILASALYWLFRDTSENRELRAAWLVASLALLAVALIQGKGREYHYYPAAAGGLLLIAVVLLGLVERQEALANVLRPRAAVLPLLLMLLLGGLAALSTTRESLAAWGPGSRQPTVMTELMRLVKEHAWKQPIYVMSSSVMPSFPLVNLTDAQWSSRFCCIWLVQGAYSLEERATQPFPYHSPQNMSELERHQIDAVVADLEAAPPALLIVDESRTKQAFGDTDFDYLKFFRRDPRFAAFFQSYRTLAQVGPYRVYRKLGPQG